MLYHTFKFSFVSIYKMFQEFTNMYNGSIRNTIVAYEYLMLFVTFIRF
jgi:hypothetical protein